MLTTAVLKISVPLDRDVDGDRKTIQLSPESKSSSGSSTPMLTTDEYRLLGRADGIQAVDVEALEQRIRTQRILEGKSTPPPDRDYSGQYGEYFREIARSEDRERKRLRGWKFLRDIILRGLTEADAKRFPAYHPTQRAYLLSYKIDGRLMPPNVRNLDACPRTDMLGLLQKIEDKGWQHVLWVANQGEGLPCRFDDKGGAEEIIWRNE